MLNLDMSKISCIYKITNTITNQIYIGSTNNYRKRKNRHVSYLKNNKHYNLKLQNSWNKYGEKSFLFEVIENISEENLLIKEQEYLDNFIDFKKDFNLYPKADRTIWSDEMKRKRSISAKEWWSNPLNKLNWSQNRMGSNNYFYGKHHSSETKEKIRIKNKGKLPPNTRKIIADNIEYISVTDASRKIGISPALVLYRIKSSKYNYNYLENA